MLEFRKEVDQQLHLQHPQGTVRPPVCFCFTAGLLAKIRIRSSLWFNPCAPVCFCFTAGLSMASTDSLGWTRANGLLSDGILTFQTRSGPMFFVAMERSSENRCRPCLVSFSLVSSVPLDFFSASVLVFLVSALQAGLSAKIRESLPSVAAWESPLL